MNLRTQRGLSTVEFALLGLLLMALLIGIVEFGRAMFTIDILQEGARRGARVAAVCPVNDPAITEAALLIDDLPGLTEENVLVEYLDADGTVLGDPAGADYLAIHFVRVRMVGHLLDVSLPFTALTFDMPAASSILPRESLGVPRFGAAAAC
jgi:hypothetical protein